jgi:hypothetical protein
MCVVAQVTFSPIFWGHSSGFGYWDRLFGMFATAFVNAGYSDVHNKTGCISGQGACTTAEHCAAMRACLNSTLLGVKELFLSRRTADPGYGLVLVTMVYTPLLMLPASTSLNEYADPGWVLTRALLTELGLAGIRIVFHEYLLEGVPNAHVLSPDNYNSGLSMVKRVCRGLNAGDQVAVIGPLLVQEQIEPSTFGPWRDLLRWERMRGYVDGIGRHCTADVAGSMLWVPESSTGTTSLSTADMEHIFRTHPKLRVVLTAFPKTVEKVRLHRTGLRQTRIEHQ